MIKIVFLFSSLSLLAGHLTGQTNPFAPQTDEYVAYASYLACAGQNCSEQLSQVTQTYDRTTARSMVVEMIYYYFISKACYDQKDTEGAETFARKCDALFAYYDQRKMLFWSDEDYRYLNGMDKADWSILRAWLVTAKGNKSLPDAQVACPACPKFPIPPPKASAQEVLDTKYFRTCKTLGDAALQITNALAKCDYERSFYSVPGGFAVVAHIEQFNGTDAAPLPAPDRWSVKLPPLRNFSDYMTDLLFGRVGYFRILVFVVTDQAFTQNINSISRQEATAWITGGLNILPPEIGQKKWTPRHRCTALVYEFNVQSATSSARNGKLVESKFSAKTHLERANLIQSLDGQ